MSLSPAKKQYTYEDYEKLPEGVFQTYPEVWNYFTIEAFYKTGIKVARGQVLRKWYEYLANA